MTPPRTTFRNVTLSAAVLGVVALLAVACTSSTANITAERAAPAGQTTEWSHDYGTSIEDWSQNPAEQEPPTVVEEPPAPDQTAAPTVMWEDLIAPGFSGQEIVDRYEAQFDAVEPGSAEADALYDQMKAEYDPEAVNPELDGQQIRLAGFVAPLTYDDEIVTEFLLVPTFGACIHVPPPPPNQTVMVKVDKANGLTTDEAWGPVWVEGTIIVAATTTDLASASYTITNAASGVYSDF